MSKIYTTPGVYIEEQSAFPNSVVPVATAVPAFIGYTEKAIRDKKSTKHIPTKISSFGEYLLYFGGGPKITYQVTDIKKKDPSRIYQLNVQKSTQYFLFNCMKSFFANGGSDCYIVSIGDYNDAKSLSHFFGEEEKEGEKVPIGITALKKYPEPTMLVIPDAVLLNREDCGTLHQQMLRHCGQDMRNRVAILDIHDGYQKRTNAQDSSDVIFDFREKIGSNFLDFGAAYYPWLHTTITSADEVDFTNIDEQTESEFIAILNQEIDTSVSEGLLTSERANEIKKEIGSMVTARKQQAESAYFEAILLLLKELQVIDDRSVEDLKTKIKEEGADIKTILQQANLTDFISKTNELPVPSSTKASGDAVPTFTTVHFQLRIDTAINTAEDLDTILKIKKEGEEIQHKRIKIKTLHQSLLAIAPLYKSIMNSVRQKINLLPPSGIMAGIYSMVDNNIGVFQSPANVSVGSVVKPSVNLTNEEQEDLNIPLNGKAVNAIRTFPGKGVLVWGARTLDGNSHDWRYISVRRTVIFIEQSIKYAVEAYVFEPNTAATWANIKALITNFLTNVWQQGALAGATAEDAFSVDIGLGVTMTPVDILDGIMRVTVKLAVTRPAEFIVITLQQKMQKS